MKIKGIYFFYRTFQALALPFLLLYFLVRALRNPGYGSSLLQRFGFLPRSFKQTGPGAIWLHAVSVGEVLSSLVFLERLRAEFPQTRIFVSTSTVAGQAVAREKLTALADGVFYAPIDTVWAVRRVLRTLQPSLLLVAETEIWPNLFREIKRTGAALAIVNGRISDRALPRYRRLAWFFRAVLPGADTILAQTEAIRERFLALGAPAGRVHTSGNFKFDFQARPVPAGSPVAAFLERSRPARIWMAASTMPPALAGDVDEDDVVLSTFRELAAHYPDLLLVLVPRKPERFDTAARKLEAAGIPYLRRSNLTSVSHVPLPGVLLLDSVGELNGLFFAADAVFLGGTLASRGGHNILEPAFFSKPVVVGPHMENFQAIAEEFRRAGACITIGTPHELAGAVQNLFDAPDNAQEIGRRALACAEAQRGATARALDLARSLYDSHLPHYRHAQPWLPLLQTLARLWTWGARRKPAHVRELAVPVISVGNLTMGGTGKTPCVLRLAADLKERGYTPGILTRGYGRISIEREIAVPAGAVISPERTGDEPQIFVRSGLAPVGIGADRFSTGTTLQNEGVDVLLLDDGFQHRKLHRDADLVLIDALNPFGGGRVFPQGRLREPLDGLARAGIVLITRSDANNLAPAIEHQIRRWNPHAPVFHARWEPTAWIENRTGERYPVTGWPTRRAAAFCGLGNPESFRRTLLNMGITLVDWFEFDDHHRYRPRELRQLREHALCEGAQVLLTTEKDAINLCEGCDDLLEPLAVYWLQGRLVIDREREFLDALETQACRE